MMTPQTLTEEQRGSIWARVQAIVPRVKKRGKWIPDDRRELAAAAVEYLRAAEDAEYVALRDSMGSDPDERLIQSYVDCFRKAPDKKNGNLYLLVRGRTDDACHTKYYIDWHRGKRGGSIWGNMMRLRDPFALAAESMVLVTRHLSGVSESEALKKWRATGAVR